jgi:rhodanese-related sulfurtransferase
MTTNNSEANDARLITDIDLTELETLRQQPNALVIDVRDEWEFEEFNLGGLNVPLPDIRARQSELVDFDPLLVICTNGTRSRVAAKDFLRQPALRHKQVYHLRGGIIEAE